MPAQQRAKSSKQAPTKRGSGPYSRLLKRGTVSGRTAEGRYLKALTLRLSEHLGGSPTVVESMLIRRLANVCLRLEQLDIKFTQGTPTDFDSKVYSALHNSFRLLCREIGLKGAAPPVPTINQYIAEKRAKEARAS